MLRREEGLNTHVSRCQAKNSFDDDEEASSQQTSLNLE